jgi:hypothetical protein
MNPANDNAKTAQAYARALYHLLHAARALRDAGDPKMTELVAMCGMIVTRAFCATAPTPTDPPRESA